MLDVVVMVVLIYLQQWQHVQQACHTVTIQRTREGILRKGSTIVPESCKSLLLSTFFAQDNAACYADNHHKHSLPDDF